MDTARFLSSSDRWLPGVARLLRVPNPAPGNDFIVTVPAGAQWRLEVAFAVLTASAGVSNRIPAFDLTIEGQTVFQTGVTAAIAANAQNGYGLTPGGTLLQFPALGTWIVPWLDGLWVPQGATIASNTTGIVAGDQWSQIALYISEVFITNPEQSEFADERYEYDLAAMRQRQG